MSELFPRPESRPSSDIDIYLFEDYERGDRLFAKDNVTKTNKRTGFDYNGIHIENHRIFLNSYTKIQERAIAYLEESLSEASITADGYYMMSPIASIVYQVMHFIAHLDDVANPLSLRFIVDFGVTLNQYQKKVSSDALKLVLLQLDIIRVFSLMLSLVEELLGLSFESYKYEKIDSKDTEAVLSLIKNRPKDFVPLVERSFMARARFYLAQYRQYDRIYKYLPKSRFEHILKSLSELFSLSIRKTLHIPTNITYQEYLKRKIQRR